MENQQQKRITTSEQIRQLWDLDMKVKDIAKELGIRYQFAYNVVQAYLAEQALSLEQQAATLIEQKTQEISRVQGQTAPTAGEKMIQNVNFLQEPPKPARPEQPAAPVIALAPPAEQQPEVIPHPPIAESPIPQTPWATVAPPPPMGTQLPPRSSPEPKRSIASILFGRK